MATIKRCDACPNWRTSSWRTDTGACIRTMNETKPNHICDADAVIAARVEMGEMMKVRKPGQKKVKHTPLRILYAVSAGISPAQQD